MEYLDFNCIDYNSLNGYTHIKIPSICCGTKIILLIPFNPHEETHFNNGSCPRHMKTYAGILTNYYNIWKKEYENSLGGQPIISPSACCICKVCNMQNEYAIPNQSDNTYICYNCK